jgi:hypothetical protein
MTELLSPPKIAKELKVSPDTVRGWIKSGALAAVNLGVAKKKPRRRVSRDSTTAAAIQAAAWRYPVLQVAIRPTTSPPSVRPHPRQIVFHRPRHLVSEKERHETTH